MRRPVDKADLRWLLPLLLGATGLMLWGLGRAPMRLDDEGTYTAQAYAVQSWGELAHYTYWYDHPPLGWLQMAGWTWLTQGFDRLAPAVVAGRELMVVMHLVSVVLLWFLARRLFDSRGAATVTAALFTLSPLALLYHRQVYLDNVAVPWLLAALLLSTARRNQLAAHAAAGLCAGVAVLTKETFLVLVIPVAWQLARHAHPATRRYTLTMAGLGFTLCGAGYLTFALLKGEVLPGEGVSVVDALRFQLVERTGSGSVLDPGSTAHETVAVWLRLDPVLPVAGLVAALVGLAVTELRPYAATYLLLALMLLRQGYLPVPYVVGMLPLAALLVVGAGLLACRVATARRRGWLPGVATATAVVTCAALIPVWGHELHTSVTADLDRPLHDAQDYLVLEADRSDRLLVDDAVWVDLVRAGFPRENVVWHYKPDTDPEVVGRPPTDWRSYDWVLVTETVREAGAQYPTVAQALEHSRTVVSYGTGEERVEVRRIDHTDR